MKHMTARGLFGRAVWSIALTVAWGTVTLTSGAPVQSRPHYEACYTTTCQADPAACGDVCVMVANAHTERAWEAHWEQYRIEHGAELEAELGRER